VPLYHGGFVNQYYIAARYYLIMRSSSVRSLSFYFLVFFMFCSGVGLTVYRHVTLDIPWLPETQKKIWSIEAKVEFEALGRSVLASGATSV